MSYPMLFLYLLLLGGLVYGVARWRGKVVAEKKRKEYEAHKIEQNIKLSEQQRLIAEQQEKIARRQNCRSRERACQYGIRNICQAGNARRNFVWLCRSS